MKIRYNGEEAMCHMGVALTWLRNDTNEVFGLVHNEGNMDEMEHSTDWKERLYAEYWQTKIRLKMLKAYINNSIDGRSTEEKEPIEILLMQENYMHGYLKCLEVSARYNGIDLGEKGNEGKQEAGQGMA